jgi:hypothetical protein
MPGIKRQETGVVQEAVPVIHVDATFEAAPLQHAASNPLARQASRWGRSWCHCWDSDHNVENLCAFAAQLGLKRAYFQNRPGFPHFDLIPSKRTLALKLGAVPISLRDWFQKQRLAENAVDGVPQEAAVS